MSHFVYTDEETVIQINTVGPWGLAYVNPKDDPRKRIDSMPIPLDQAVARELRRTNGSGVA